MPFIVIKELISLCSLRMSYHRFMLSGGCIPSAPQTIYSLHVSYSKCIYQSMHSVHSPHAAQPPDQFYPLNVSRLWGEKFSTVQLESTINTSFSASHTATKCIAFNSLLTAPAYLNSITDHSATAYYKISTISNMTACVARRLCVAVITSNTFTI